MFKHLLLVSIMLLLVASAVDMKPAAADDTDFKVSWGIPLNYQVKEIKERIDGNFSVYIQKQEITADKDGLTKTVKRTYWDNVTSETKLLWVPNWSHIIIEPNPNCKPERIAALQYSLNNCAGWKVAELCEVKGFTHKVFRIEVTPEEAMMFPGNIVTLHALLELKDGDVKKRWLWIVPLGTSKSPSDNHFLVQWKRYEARCQQTWGELMFYQSQMQKRWGFGGSPSDPDWISAREAAAVVGANKPPKDGVQGVPGKDGRNGSQWHFGNGAPAADLGCDGDCYIDCESSSIWQKAEGKWVFRCTIKGKDGINGTNGKDGINGTNGTNGTNGRDAGCDLFSDEGFVRMHFVGAVWPEWMGYELWVDGISSWKGMPNLGHAVRRTDDLLWMYHIGDPDTVKPNKVLVKWIDLRCGNIISEQEFNFTHLRCKPVSHYLIPIGDWQSYARALPQGRAQQQAIFTQRKTPVVLTGVGPFTSEEFAAK